MLYHLGPNPTADMIVVNISTKDQKILLIRRSKFSGTEPSKLALPGGFVETTAPAGTRWAPGIETYLQAAKRELMEETGLDLSSLPDEDFRLLGIYNQADRDPRNSNISWTESHVYTIQIPSDKIGEIAGNDDAEDAFWCSQDELLRIPKEDFAFDHYMILKENGFLF